VYAVSLAGLTMVEELTHSTTLNAVTLLSAILPAFLGSLIAGAVVDRLGKVRVLLASQAAWALTGLVFWLATGMLSPTWAIFAILSANTSMALVSQFALSAEYALLPVLVDPALLLQANSLFQISLVAGEGLGVFLLAPMMIKMIGIPSVGVIAAILCLLGLALVARLPREATQAPEPAKERQNWRALAGDLRAGWQVIARDPVLGLVTVQATLAAALLLILIALLPGLASRYLGVGVENMPFLLLPGGLGFALGLVLVNHWESRLDRLVWIGGGLAALGVGIALLAAGSVRPPLFAPILISLLIIGLGLALTLIPARTVLQERPPAEVRARVISTQLALGNAAAVIPLLLGGSLADQIGIQPLLVLMALVSALAGLVGIRMAQGRSASEDHRSPDTEPPTLT
jgi:MFS family permease